MVIECEAYYYWFNLKSVDLDSSELNTINKRGDSLVL